MVQTKADSGVTSGAYQKMVATRAWAPVTLMWTPLFLLRKLKGGMQGTIPFAWGPPHHGRKELESSSACPLSAHQRRTSSEKMDQVKEPGCSGIGKHRRKAVPLPLCPAEHDTCDDDQVWTSFCLFLLIDFATCCLTWLCVYNLYIFGLNMGLPESMVDLTLLP